MGYGSARRSIVMSPDDSPFAKLPSARLEIMYCPACGGADCNLPRWTAKKNYTSENIKVLERLYFIAKIQIFYIQKSKLESISLSKCLKCILLG